MAICMPITPWNILRHEIIGLECMVLKSKNKALEGIVGTVVDETKNMITIRKNGKFLRIPKKYSEFVFILPGGKKVKINGSMFLVRPENRIRLKFKKW